MATQTLVVSSFTPKLAAFNSRNTTHPQLALPKSPPVLNYRSSSLPTPSLHLKSFNFKSDFKCQAFKPNQPAAPVPVVEDVAKYPGQWIPIQDVEHNKYVQALGQLAVDKENKNEQDPTKQITFMRVVEAEEYKHIIWFISWISYRMRIEGEVNKVDKAFQALLYVGPVDLWSFLPIPWDLQK